MLDALTRLSAQIGADPMLVQGGGGNTSCKAPDGRLWVKGSGTWLSRAQEKPIFTAVDLNAARAAIDSDADDPMAGLFDPDAPLRPSIETTLHALMPHAVVLHMHSIRTLAWAVRADGPERVAERLDGLRWAWIPYRRPGAPLTQAVRAAMGESPDVLILANHGLVVGGADCAAAEALLAEVERRLDQPYKHYDESDLSHVSEVAPDADYRLPTHAVAQTLAMDPLLLPKLNDSVLYPDHAVYLGPGCCVAMGEQGWHPARDAYKVTYGVDPAFIIWEGRGTWVREELKPGGEEMLRALALLANRLEPRAELATLNDREVADLLDWDAEKFRQSLDA
ncbi:class II aldolase/adducin family protein [Magnetofaba australis]|uniref:Putative aldolase n=1 Tax=Magnetofaba australis IT-1 TaxID=1434232 RepID=A0A1Y2K2T0_9PROT|nr:class II aldolase/adducin family protein [Magnetofaba australis]OSM02282.1 putative aldolase [Magnetofaba australis IT-1]